MRCIVGEKRVNRFPFIYNFRIVYSLDATLHISQPIKSKNGEKKIMLEHKWNCTFKWNWNQQTATELQKNKNNRKLCTQTNREKIHSGSFSYFSYCFCCKSEEKKNGNKLKLERTHAIRLYELASSKIGCAPRRTNAKQHNKWLLLWRKVVLFDNMLLLLLIFFLAFASCLRVTIQHTTTYHY